MIKSLIEHHKQLSNNIYEYIDPNLKLNNVNGNYKPTQEEIINEILKNNLNDIEIKYLEDYVIKYTQLDENQIKLIPTEPNSVHLLRLVGLKNIPNYVSDFDIVVQKKTY